MRHLVIFLFFIVLISCENKEHSNHSDQSIKKLLDGASSNTDKKIRESNLDTLYQYLTKHHNDSVNRNLLFKVSGLYYELENYDKYLSTTQKIHELAVENKDTAHMAKSLYFIGDYYENEILIDSAFKYYSKAEKLYKNIGDTLNIGRTTLYKSGILYDAGIFTESEIQTTIALQFLITTKNDRLIYESYNLMALNLKELNDHDASVKYFNLALDRLNYMEKDTRYLGRIMKSKASIYNNMGSLYEKIKNYPEAIKLYQKGLQLKNIRTDYPRLYAMLLNNLANSKMKAGHNGGEIERLLFESLKIRENNNFQAGIISNKISLGEFYLAKHDTIRAIKYLKQAYASSKKINSSYDTKQALKLLSENYKTNNNYYDALYIKISDSLYNLERITKNKFARIAYETNQIEKKNKFLSKRNKTITVGAIIIILILGVSFIIQRLRTKNKELLLVKQQKEANEKIYQLMLQQHSESDKIRSEERNRIAMELHDGIVNRIFTARFNLMQLQPEQTLKKEQLVEELMAAETEIRKVSHELQQNLLFEDNSFQKALTDLIKIQQNEFDTTFDLTIDKYINWSLISSENKIHVYRIIQEALQNINKYAKAKRTDVMLLKTGNKTTLRIWDDGIGFNLEKVKYGIGLKNIQQRTNALQGKLTIISDKENGTKIDIVF